jgi:16S rRNA (cytosine967-C5)-methyltransferase
VQDGGSQLTCEAVAALPGETVMDLCAGAGARLWRWPPSMGKGRLVACDVDRARLQRLAPRAERAGAPLIETLLMNPNRERRLWPVWRARPMRC